MLGLKFNHVSKSGPWYPALISELWGVYCVYFRKRDLMKKSFEQGEMIV